MKLRITFKFFFNKKLKNKEKKKKNISSIFILEQQLLYIDLQEEVIYLPYDHQAVS